MVNKIILKMRVRFGDAAADVTSQEVIAKEVTAYLATMPKGSTMKEEDLKEVESRIRAQICGGTPRKMTMVMEKKAQADGDEWAKMYKYNIELGKIQEQAEMEAKLKRQAETRSTLKGQMAELEESKAREKLEEQAYYKQEQATLKRLDEKERQKAELQASLMARLAVEREQQLTEKNQRKAKALEKVRKEDEELAQRLAYEAKRELEAEEAARTAAKEQLVTFLKGNEANKAIREAEKQRQAEEDAYYKAAWEAKLDKQEADRKALLTKNRIKQTLQEQAASQREESKRWMPQEIIDKAYREAEDRRAAEEVARAAKVRANAQKAVATYAGQIKEREAAKLAQRKEDERLAAIVMETARRKTEEEDAKLRARHQAGQRFKAELEAQMKHNAAKRRVAPMSEAERKINTQLLDKVYDWQTTGRVTQG